MDGVASEPRCAVLGQLAHWQQRSIPAFALTVQYISVAGIPLQVMCRSIAALAYLHLQVTRPRFYKLLYLEARSDRTEGYTLTRTPLHESRRLNDPVKRTSC